MEALLREHFAIGLVAGLTAVWLFVLLDDLDHWLESQQVGLAVPFAVALTQVGGAWGLRVIAATVLLLLPVAAPEGVSSSRLGRAGPILAALLVAVEPAWRVGWTGRAGVLVVLLALVGVQFAQVAATPRPNTLLWLLLTICAAGQFGTLADTEGALVLLGTSAVLLAGSLWLALPMGSVGWLAAAMVTVNVAMTFAGRPGAMVGGVACLGLFAVLPLMGRPTLAAAGITVVAHAAYVLYASRVAGLEQAAGDAFRLLTWPTAGLVVVAIGLIAWSRRTSGRG